MGLVEGEGSLNMLVPGGAALCLGVLMMVCINCWRERSASLMLRRGRVHSTSQQAPRHASRPHLPPAVEAIETVELDNDEDDFEEPPARGSAPRENQAPASLRNTRKSGTDADSHGSYVNIQDDYVNVIKSTVASSPVSETLYLKVLPAVVQVDDRSDLRSDDPALPGDHSYENVEVTATGHKASVGSGNGFDYENVMGPWSL